VLGREKSVKQAKKKEKRPSWKREKSGNDEKTYSKMMNAECRIKARKTAQTDRSQK